jgi:hypothetical protein
LKGSVQAAISRPYADEFRSLTDNQPLLQQVAKMTGGKVLTGVPERDELWRREGIEMPVATKPIWLVFALSGIGIFLLDVAVRRVRIDIVGMARAVGKGFQAGKVKAATQMDALQKARQVAQEQMARRADRGTTGAVDASAPPAPGVAKVKFEAPKGTVHKKDVQIAVGGDQPRPAAKPGEKKETTKEEGMSRLMQAKRRARDEMTEE